MYPGERINSISHLTGAALALLGGGALIALAALNSDGWMLVSSSIYSATLFLLFLSSTLYHSLRPPVKDFFQKLDHIAIYYLIAGTYTPFALGPLRSSLGWVIFGVVWGMALVGTIYKARYGDTHPVVSTIIYVICGWAILIDLGGLLDLVPGGAIAFLFIGGGVYTLGAVIYSLDKFHRNHEIWHFMVLGGAICHFLAIALYLV